MRLRACALHKDMQAPCQLHTLPPRSSPPPIPPPTHPPTPPLSFRYAGVLSAVGIHMADIVQEAQEPCAQALGPATMPRLGERLALLEGTAAGKLRKQARGARWERGAW